MKNKDEMKYLMVAIIFSVIIVLVKLNELQSMLIYVVILLYSIFVLKILKMTPIEGEVSDSVLLMCSVFFINLMLQYFFRRVWEDPHVPDVYTVYLSSSPGVVGLVIAPMLEELAFRRVFLGALLKANMHWLAASCVTTILFMSVHPPADWTTIAVTSLLLSTIYALSGNLKLTIFLHFSHNFVFRLDPVFWRDLLL